MPDDSGLEKSVLEQIVDEMFTSLDCKDPFDAHSVDLLKQLAQKGDLSKASRVQAAIRADQGLNE